MVRMVAALACCVAVFARAHSLDAHPLHTSFTEITRDRAGGRVSISVRLFADDFGALMDSLHAQPASRALTLEAVAQRYVAQSLWLSSAGKRVRLDWCGMRTEGGLTWVCARSAESVRAGQLRLRNALMFDRFEDQISIVRWTIGSASRTLVLSARAPEALLD